MSVTAIEKIQRHAKRIEGGKAKVHPGQPYRFSEASQAGDGVAQGDLHLILVDKVPIGYTKVKNPTDADRQLVPGNTEGAKHCLDSLDGVTLYRPDGWPASVEDDMLGPVLVLKNERTILHPKHGHVTVLPGSIIQCTYQPEYDAQLKRSRRNAD